MEKENMNTENGTEKIDYTGWACLALVAFMFISCVVICFGGCNRQILDLKMNFTKAHVRWPDGKAEVIDIKKWKDYNDSDQIQIIDKSGKVYIFHSSNIVLEGD